MSSSLITAVSPSSSLVAVLSPTDRQSSASTLRVLLLHRTSGDLQTTLTYKHPKGSESTSGKAENSLEKLVFLSETFLACWVARWNKIIVWDLSRGVCSYTLPSTSSDTVVETADDALQICDIATDPVTTEDDRKLYVLYLLTGRHKLQIHQFRCQNGKLERKIKAGKFRKTQQPHSSSLFHPLLTVMTLESAGPVFVVRSDPSILRVLGVQSGAKVYKLTIPSSNNERPATAAALAGMEGILVTTTSPSGKIVAWNLNPTNESAPKGVELPMHSTRITSSNSGTASPTLDVRCNNDGRVHVLIDGTTWCGLESVLSSNTRTKSLTAPADVAAWSVSLVWDTDSTAPLIAILCKNGHYQVRTLTVEDSDDSDDAPIQLQWTGNEDAESEESPTARTKRKLDNVSTVLGPAQAGGEALTATELQLSNTKYKKTKTQDDGAVGPMDEAEDGSNEPTIAARLAKLRQALEEEDEMDEENSQTRSPDESAERSELMLFQPKRATTESLTRLLKQALNSNDDAMLELALAVRDTTIVRETCLHLSDGSSDSDVDDADLLPLLLTAITSRLAFKPARADQLCLWIKIILQTGKIRSLSHLQPLQNLLQERLEVFPALLKLEGRLSMMGSL